MSVLRTGRLCFYFGSSVRRVHHRTMSIVPDLSVRCVSGEERMKICFDYVPDGNKPRTFNMDRPQSEEVGKALARLKANIVSKASGKKRKKKAAADGNSEPDIPVEFTVNSEPIADSTPNKDAWIEGAQLRVGDAVYVVSVNPPAVVSITLPDSIMAGFPIFPAVQLDFAEEKNSQFVWRRVRPVKTPAEQTTSKSAEPPEYEVVEEVSREMIYAPSNADVGFHLQLTCTPWRSGRQGRESIVTSKVEVSPGPGLCPFDHRHLYTPLISDPARFRVVSYNILADLYADSDFSRQQLYPYCPPYALDQAYRRQLLLKELKGYNGDVVCLQEVDKKLFERELTTAMGLLGLQGVLRCKGEQGGEGCATFFRTDKFSLLAQHDIAINEELQNNSANADLLKLLAGSEETAEKILTRSTVVQVTVLAVLGEEHRCLVVANTHLYFHPLADNVRLLQGTVALRHLQAVCDQLCLQGKEPALVFCGDFNCRPSKGVAKFLMAGKVAADDDVWKSGEDKSAVPGTELHHDFALVSGCGVPAYTNYVGGFHGTLDYVFLDRDRLTVDAIIPPPEDDDITQFVALPSLVMPSDHIAQICDLSWKS